MKTSARERFRYWFDGVMARGTGALMVLLAIVTVLFIAVVALAVQVFGLFPAGATGRMPPTSGRCSGAT